MPSDAVPRDKRDIILVVEDDPGIGALIGDLLAKEGWETELLSMGRAALARLEKIPPVLVLLDYVLPDMNGKEFVARAASMPPFIIVTGMGDERIAVEMMKSGARDYLIKDRNIFDVLSLTIRLVLEQVDTEKRLVQANQNLREAVVRDITERKLAEEEINRLLEAERRKISELTHSNALIAALSHVAARAGAAADPDQVMGTIGTELRTLGLDCFISFLEAEARVFRIRYVSIPANRRSDAERFAHSKMIGFPIKTNWLKALANVIEGRRSVFLKDVFSIALHAVPRIPKPAFRKALEAVGIGPGTLAAALPLSVENAVLGFMVLWGAGLRETDLPVFSAFANQVSINLKQTSLFNEIQTARRQLEILSTQLLNAQENERRKLATELHDNIGQVFTAVKTNLQAFQLAAAQPGLRPRLDESINAVSIALDQVRTLALELRPSVLDDFGLVAALN